MMRSVFENSDGGAEPSGREPAGKIEAEVTPQFSHDAPLRFDLDVVSQTSPLADSPKLLASNFAKQMNAT